MATSLAHKVNFVSIKMILILKYQLNLYLIQNLFLLIIRKYNIIKYTKVY